MGSGLESREHKFFASCTFFLQYIQDENSYLSEKMKTIYSYTLKEPNYM